MFKQIYFYFLFTLFLISNSHSNIEIKARTAILQDFLSGEILYEKEPDRSIYPASMTKIMTSIIAFDLIKSGDLSLDDKFMYLKRHGVYHKLVTHQCLSWLVMRYLSKIYFMV